MFGLFSNLRDLIFLFFSMFGMLSLFGELLCDHFMESPNSGSVPTPNISRQSKASRVIFLLCGQPEGLLDGSRSPNYWFREFLVNRILFSFAVWLLEGCAGRLLMCFICCLKSWSINVGLRLGLDKHPVSQHWQRKKTKILCTLQACCVDVHFDITVWG